MGASDVMYSELAARYEALSRRLSSKEAELAQEACKNAQLQRQLQSERQQLEQETVAGSVLQQVCTNTK